MNATTPTPDDGWTDVCPPGDLDCALALAEDDEDYDWTADLGSDDDGSVPWESQEEIDEVVASIMAGDFS